MNLERRIRALEDRLALKAITLVMPDGTRHKIPGDGQFLLSLFCEAGRKGYAERCGEPIPEVKHPVELDLVMRSVRTEGEEGRMTELIKAALSPANPR